MFTVPIGEWFRDRQLSVAARPADRQRHGPAPVRTAVVDAMVQAHREGRGTARVSCAHWPHSHSGRSRRRRSVRGSCSSATAAATCTWGAGRAGRCRKRSRAGAGLGLTTAADVVRAAGLPAAAGKDFVGPAMNFCDRPWRTARGHAAVRRRSRQTRAYLRPELRRPEAEVRASTRPRGGTGRTAGRRSCRWRCWNASLAPWARTCWSPRTRARGTCGRARRARARIPAACIVDLFAIDEVRWIGQPGYADRSACSTRRCASSCWGPAACRTKWSSPAPRVRCPA